MPPHVRIANISPYLNVSENVFFSRKYVAYLVRKKFDMAFSDMCNPRHIYSVTKDDRKIVCRSFGPVQAEFHFLVPGFLWNSSSRGSGTQKFYKTVPQICAMGFVRLEF